MKRTLLALALAIGAVGSLGRAASAGEVYHQFVVPPGGHVCFALPAVQFPVHVMISETLLNGGTQTPSEVFEAIVNQDPKSTQMTWIGTNSDGTQKGSNSLVTPLIASLWGGAAPTVNAELRVCSLPNRQIGIFQNARTTALPGHYDVTLLF
jgi:hypothetical protein